MALSTVECGCVKCVTMPRRAFSVAAADSADTAASRSSHASASSGAETVVTRAR
jgi:hypothetical protein